MEDTNTVPVEAEQAAQPQAEVAAPAPEVSETPAADATLPA